MSQNRRIEYRILADLRVHRFELPGEPVESATGVIRELSASGCRLECSVPLQVNQELRLSFQLLDGHQVENARARVVRRLSQRSRRVVALEFLDLPEPAQLLIREYIVWRESQEAVS
ncbi:MAG: PilZ domain-containing protein [candidate division FCPU426 bacterium]